MGPVFSVVEGVAGSALEDPEWDELAQAAGSPYLLRAWLVPFAEASDLAPVVAQLREDGRLLAAAALARGRGGFASLADDHTGDWDAVALGADARGQLWRHLGALGARRLRLRGMREGPAREETRGALVAAGFDTYCELDVASPYLRLPSSFDDLLASRSSNTRSQWRRRRRQLERAGRLEFRTVTGGPDLDRELDALFAVEASGWKGREGTAIASSERTEHLYRRFAHALAIAGQLRLYLLELDGRLLAGDLGCVVGHDGFLIKTGFDEASGEHSPGLVLRGEVLRASIGEGLSGYDFLGGPDSYKTRWTAELRPRSLLVAERGSAQRAWRRLRPVLSRVRGALPG